MNPFKQNFVQHKYCAQSEPEVIWAYLTHFKWLKTFCLVVNGQVEQKLFNLKVESIQAKSKNQYLGFYSSKIRRNSCVHDCRSQILADKVLRSIGEHFDFQVWMDFDFLLEWIFLICKLETIGIAQK